MRGRYFRTRSGPSARRWLLPSICLPLENANCQKERTCVGVRRGGGHTEGREGEEKAGEADGCYEDEVKELCDHRSEGTTYDC